MNKPAAAEPNFNARTAKLNHLRARHPHDPEIAQDWCRLALQLGQFKQARQCAIDFYARETAPFERASWARLGGMAAFRDLNLQEALAAFQLSLRHLCDLAEAGQLPRRVPPKASPNAFANGVANQLYWSTATALARAGFAAFAHAGTLLGLQREGQLLPFDKDIDLGIWSEDFDACRAWLLAHGWKAFANFPPYRHYCALLDPHSGVTLDLLGMQRKPEQQQITFGFFLDQFGPQYQSARTVAWFELVRRDTPFGVVWFIDEPERMLSALYGDWRTPNPYWDGMVSNICIEELTHLWRCHGYDRLVMRWMNGEVERAWSYAHQILIKDASDAGALRTKQSLGAILARINPDALQWPPRLAPNDGAGAPGLTTE